MPTVLIVGATRGLGASLASLYASAPNTTVYGTTRSPAGPKELQGKKIHWVPHIDVSHEGVGTKLVEQLRKLDGEVKGFDVVVITAGYFGTESWEEGPKWKEQVKM